MFPIPRSETARWPRRKRGLVVIVATAALFLPLAVRALDVDTEVEILAYEDAREVSPELLAYLQDDEPATRGRAALAVGRIGRALDVARLAALLQDEDVGVRRDAAFALGEIEDSTAAFPLEELLLSGFETDAEVRELAVDGLGKLGRGAEACRAALHDGAERVQARALLSAWRIPGATDTEEILQFSRHKKVEVRWCGAYCLMRMLGAPASGRTPIPGGTELTDDERDQIATRLLVLTEADDPRVVLQAVRGVRTRPEDDVTSRMVSLLQHPDWRVRVEAIRTLAATLPTPDEGDDPGSDGDAESGDSADTELEPANSSVAPTPDRRTVPMESLEPLLGDQNPNVVATLLEALARIGDETATQVLYSELSNPIPRHRELALRSLGTRERDGDTNADTNADTAARERFLRELSKLAEDPVWFVRAACIDFADLLPEDDRSAMLLKLARDEPRIAKLAVGPYLEQRDGATGGWPAPAEFQPELDEFLSSDDPMVVLMTIGALDEVFQRAVEARGEGGERSEGAEGSEGSDEGEDDTDGEDGTDGTRPTDDETGEAVKETGSARATLEITPEWGAFVQILEAQRARSENDPLWTDVRQSIVGIAAPRIEIPEMEALLVRSTLDPNFLVRRDAVQALEDAGRPVPREAGPVETRHDRDELRAILEWAREDHRAVFETAAGTFEARLFTRDAPLTCWNFARLAESGFYDDGAWHRVVPNFVLQDGCPRGDGWGGPPYQIRCEVNRRRYSRGALGMALAGKDTGGSQFFFTHSAQPHLDGGYTVFGELVQGRRTAELVSQGDPITRIRVVRD